MPWQKSLVGRSMPRESNWEEISAVGLGAAGTLDIKEGRVVDASNLPGWNGFPLGPRARDRLDRPTVLLNDANAAAFGEFWAGAGRKTNSLVLFTLGTGIGCGIVESGRILEGRNGLGGECGHMTIQMDGGRRCSCGKSGHLEAYASATSVVRRATEALEFDSESTLLPSLIDASLSCALIVQHALEGDRLAARLMKETARCLGIGAANVMQTVDPELVLFGGGMIAAGAPFLEAIRAEVREHASPAVAGRTRVEFAALSGDAGFIGAAGWARKTIFGR